MSCLLLTKVFNPHSLKNKLPSMWATGQRLDTLSNSKQSSNHSDAKLKIKNKNRSKAEVYKEARQRFEMQNET